MTTNTLGTIVRGKKAGLNNQKIVLLGLCYEAFSRKLPLILPMRLVDLNARDPKSSEKIKLSSVFNIEKIDGFLKNFGIERRTDEGDTHTHIEWEDCFMTGISMLKFRNGIEKKFCDSFLLGFSGSNEILDIAQKISDELDGSVAVQLRIEQDWQGHITRRMQKDPAGVYLRTHGEIFSKIMGSHQFDGRSFFLCCDRNAIDTPKQDIRSDISSEFGVNVLFKDDLKASSLLPQSAMQNAMIDFHVCLNLDDYVGLSQSSFSNILCATKSAMMPGNSPSHYIFNVPTPGVLKRIDEGRSEKASQCVSAALYAVPPSNDDN